MDFTPMQLFAAAVVATLVLVGGGGVALALVFTRLNYMLAEQQIAAAAPKEPKKAVDPALKARRASAYRLGVVVLAGLAALTAVENLATLVGASTVALFIVALLKAGLILQYFMHVASLWVGEGSHG